MTMASRAKKGDRRGGGARGYRGCQSKRPQKRDYQYGIFLRRGPGGPDAPGAGGERPTVVVVDPPKGMQPELLETIAAMAPRRIVYVSATRLPLPGI